MYDEMVYTLCFLGVGYLVLFFGSIYVLVRFVKWAWQKKS